MKKVRITVLKREFYPELADAYLSDGREAGPCPLCEAGDEYVYCGGAEKPDGLCPWAWITLYGQVSVLSAGSSENRWYRDSRTRIECCTDGVRPVVFRLEALDEDIED